MTGPVCQECGEPIPAERAAHARRVKKKAKFCSKRCCDRFAGRVRRERLKGRKIPPVRDPGRADWWCLTCGHRIADERAANTVSRGREPKYCSTICGRHGWRSAGAVPQIPSPLPAVGGVAARCEDCDAVSDDTAVCDGCGRRLCLMGRCGALQEHWMRLAVAGACGGALLAGAAIDPVVADLAEAEVPPDGACAGPAPVAAAAAGQEPHGGCV